MLKPFLLDERIEFPPPEQALTNPPGLLAIGGDLSVERLQAAYKLGIFPWFSEGDPLLWWSLDPRLILEPDQIKISKSLQKTIKKFTRTPNSYVTLNKAFQQVIQACSEPRSEENAGTWISPDIQKAYGELHQHGLAHSIEVWHDQELVGGLYGVNIGHVFYGESMFSRASDRSKIALVYLCRFLSRQGVKLVDCQQETRHLASMGARSIPRSLFQSMLAELTRHSNVVSASGYLNEDGYLHPFESSASDREQA